MTSIQTGAGNAAVAPRAYAVLSGDGGGPGAGQGSAQSTDDEFIRQLRVRFGVGLFSFVLRLTEDRDWAEDVVQMTLIRAWRSRDKLAAAGDSARTWLYTVARHIFVDDYRARSARPTLLTGDLRAIAEANDIDRVVLSLAIDQALATLSEAHRQAVVCTLLQQHSTAEAACILGVSEGTVKSRVHYGIRALRKALEGSRTRARPATRREWQPLAG